MPQSAIGYTDSYQLASQTAEGLPANGPSSAGDLSADGRFVVFSSSASNLMPGDTNANQDVFVKDTLTGGVERISIATDGSQMGGGGPSISNDGRYVVFVSGKKAYVRDRAAGTTSEASPAGHHDSPHAPNISGDGRYVVFSTIDRLIPEDTNSCLPLPPGLPKPQDYDYCRDVYMKDMVSGTLSRVSVATNGIQGNHESSHGYISSDGRFVVFSSAAYNLVPHDYNGQTDLFIRDLAAGTTRMLTQTIGGGLSNGSSIPSAISADGRFVAFTSTATNLALGDPTPLTDIYVFDVQTSTITLESAVSDSASPGHRFHLSPTISDDGQRVGFSAIYYDGVAIMFDSFVRDRIKGFTVEVGARALGDRKTQAMAGGLSGDGGTFIFTSDRSLLVQGDTNGVQDAFLLRLTPTCASGGREDGSASSLIRKVETEPAATTTHSISCAVIVSRNL